MWLRSFQIRSHFNGSINAAWLEANDERQLQHRYMQVEGMAGLAPALIEETLTLPPQATRPMTAPLPPEKYTSSTGTIPRTDHGEQFDVEGRDLLVSSVAVFCHGEYRPPFDYGGGDRHQDYLLQRALPAP